MSQEPTPAQPTAQTVHFSLPSEFHAQLEQCLGRAHTLLQMFDPNFSTWGWNHAEPFQLMRHFLLARPENRIQIAYHSDEYLERECARFMPFLVDFSHAIECRHTPRNLRQLTDSFALADDCHVVRRFHCDHFRGEAVFDSHEACHTPAKRFGEIWSESDIGLQAGRVGL
jgi:hypothetical protein